MDRVVFGRTFLKDARKLPAAQQKKLAALLEELAADPFSPLLHSKPLSGPLTGQYSFRITRDWRVVFVFVDREKVKLIDVLHRKDI